MQFETLADGSRHSLPKPSIDTGMGLERIAAVMQGEHDNYDIDTVVELVTEARKWRDRKRASSAPIYPHDRVLIRAIDRIDRDDDPEEHGTPTETGATDRQGRCTVPEPPPGPDGRCGASGRHRA